MERQDRCHQRLDELSRDFRADVDLGQFAVGRACGLSDFRFPEDDWRAGTTGSAGGQQCARANPVRIPTKAATYSNLIAATIPT
jgi:hypothetical protein